LAEFEPWYEREPREREQLRRRETELSKALILASVIHHLPEGTQEDAVAEGLHCVDGERGLSIQVQGIGDVEDVALAGLLRHLSHRLIQPASNLVASIEQRRGVPLPEARAALAWLLHGAPAEQALQNAVDAAVGMGEEEVRPDAVARIIPTRSGVSLQLGSMSYQSHVTSEDPQRLQDDVLLRPWGKEAPLEALVRVLPYLSGPLLDRASNEALRLARPKRREVRARVLAVLAVRKGELGEPAQALSLARDIDDRNLRSHALAGLGSILTALPLQDLARLWTEQTEGQTLLRSLSRRTREDLLSDILALEPIVAALGRGATASIFAAVKDVSQWWP
jgi:hypothetical protein